jgi:tripartite motif-containing protein 2/3
VSPRTVRVALEEMAAAQPPSVADELANILECIICRNTYDDPRTLPCLHTYCLKCLLRWSQSAAPHGKELECPVCRKECAIPEGGLEELPRSFFVDKLKQLKENYRASVLQCDGDFPDGLEASTCVADSCETHRSKSIDLFCLDCHDVLCSLCFNSRHKTHSCIDVALAADEMMLRTQNDVEGGIEKCRRMLRSLAGSKREFVDEIDKMEDEIYRTAELMKQAVCNRRQALVDELEAIKRNRLKEMDRLDKEVEQQWLTMRDLKLYVAELVKIGTPVNRVRESKALREKTGELKKIDRISRSLKDLSSKLVKFTPAFETAVGSDAAALAAERNNILGRIEGYILCQRLFVFYLSLTHLCRMMN